MSANEDNTDATSEAGLRPGIYRHYKGNDYELIGVATHSESGEVLVVYRPLYGDRALWARPLSMWSEQVTVEGEAVPRFRYLQPAP